MVSKNVNKEPLISEEKIVGPFQLLDFSSTSQVFKCSKRPWNKLVTNEIRGEDL